MMRPLCILTALVVLVVLAIAGCGGKNADEATKAYKGPGAAPANKPAPPVGGAPNQGPAEGSEPASK